MKKESWHYLSWKQFNRTVFHSTITAEDKTGRRFFLDTFHKINGKEAYEIDVKEKCWKFEKGEELYILKEDFLPLLPLDPGVYVEGYLKESDKTLHRLVTKPISARIEPKKTMGFRHFIYNFNPLEHSHERTRVFLNMVAIASKHKPIKIRLCGPPACGKNMNFNILKYITNDMVKLAKPTLAKLETALYFNNVIVIDEMTSLAAAQVREVEPTFLSIADESPELEKHSMAKKKDINLMHLDQTSIIFPYNRIYDLSEGAVFFDDVWQNKQAFQSRYPAVLLEGTVTEKKSKMNVKEAKEHMEDNWESMAEWCKNALYFMENLNHEMHGYERPSIRFRYARQATNFEGILDCVDAYCDSQQEFNEWCGWIDERIKAYEEMVEGHKIEVTEEVIK